MSTTPSSAEKARQEPFRRVAPLLRAALLLGAGGGFLLAMILTLTRAFSLPLGAWWTALAQAHGHLQLYGWAGLFVIGVAFHFLPRLRGAPLAAPRLVPWLLGGQVTALLIRALSQPLLAATGEAVWRILLVLSGVLECAALVTAAALLLLTARSGPPLATRQAFKGILPFIAGAFGALGIAAIVNLVDVTQAALGAGLVPGEGDNLNVTLGLFGFLVPVALAMSARSLPMYAGLEAFPPRVMWPLAYAYMIGIALTAIGTGWMSLLPWLGIVYGLGMVMLGVVMLIFVAVFLRLMRTRGRLPQRVAQLAPTPDAVAQSYRARVVNERANYGPFVGLIASSYMWAVLGALLLVGDGLALLFGRAPFFSLDAIRHSFAVGFIALLLCGVAPRMIPGFSGHKIAGPGWVTATFWLGNCAALLRVGSLLLLPVLLSFGSAGFNVYAALFGLSGPVGLALAICLAVNLWPALAYP